MSDHAAENDAPRYGWEGATIGPGAVPSHTLATCDEGDCVYCATYVTPPTPSREADQ